MNEQQTEEQSASKSPGISLNGVLLISGLFLAILMGALGYWLGTRQSTAPGNDSVEVGFARDMIMHHAQAVDMATLLRDRTEDPDLRQISLDMALTQQAQIGQMQGWLNVWDQPLASMTPAMTWMGMPTTSRMPGMAAPEQINQLRNLKGAEADGLFLQLMIVHHRSAVDMGEAALDRSQNPVVRALAQSIVNSQANEIALLEDLLTQKGFPLPPKDAGSHNTH